MMDLTSRELTLAIAFPIVIAIFIILGTLILRKDKKYWGNRFFALFFWLTAVALAFNLLYLFWHNEVIIIVFNIATIELVNMAVCCMLLGILIINKGEDEILHNIKVYSLIVILIALIVGHIFVPSVTVGAEYDPSWGIFFGIYEIVFSQTILALIFYFSLTLFKELTPEMKKKFKLYLIGLIFLDLTLLSISIDNLNIFGTAYATIGAALNFGVVLGALLIYLGIVRK